MSKPGSANLFSRCLMLLLVILFFSVGCSKTPVPSSYPYSLQKKMQAANHWQVLAKDIGNDIYTISEAGTLGSQPLKITTHDNSPFTQAFRSLLATELLGSGIGLTNDPNAKHELFWSVQQVKHNETGRTFTRLPIGSYVGMSALGYGAYKLWTDSTEFAKFLVAGVGSEVGIRSLDYLAKTRMPQNEIIINVTIQSGNDLLYRFSNIYYINDLDTAHYFFSNDLFYTDRNVETKVINVKKMN